MEWQGLDQCLVSAEKEPADNTNDSSPLYFVSPSFMTTYIDEDPLPPIHAIVFGSEAAMLAHLDIYHDPNTRFYVRTWSGECVLTPLALAVEITARALDFATILSVPVDNTGCCHKPK